LGIFSPFGYFVPRKIWQPCWPQYLCICFPLTNWYFYRQSLVTNCSSRYVPEGHKLTNCPYLG
jgi:hypothetical protein